MHTCDHINRVEGFILHTFSSFFNGYEVGIDTLIFKSAENIGYKTEYEKDSIPWVFVQEH